MARTLTGPSAVEVIEEAIHLLRTAVWRSLALVWVGAVPFAMGALLFWRDMTNHRGGDMLCAFESLLLVVLLLWMNVWRGILTVTLHARLAGLIEPPALHAIASRAIGVQLLAGNFKLLVLPLAALVILPLPGAVAFFRIAIGISAVEKIGFFDTVAKARKLASSITQPVRLTLLIGFIALLFLVNILVALALMPHIVLALTGYDSSFTRAGLRILADPSFYLVAGLITWLALEPLTQAVYAVAAFYAESNETGEDVRIRFRALVRIAGSAAALLLILATSLPAARARLDASELDRSIRQTMGSPEYGWHVRAQDTKGSNSQFVTFTDSIARGLGGVVKVIGQGIDLFGRWLRGLFESPATGRNGRPAGGEIRIGLYLASLLVLVGAGYLVWRGRAAFVRKHAAIQTPVQAVNLAAEDLTADELPEEHWYILADECLRTADFRLGLRALHLATLAWLGREQWIVIHPGKTDHEYESELRRRARGFPGACLQFSSNIDAFERTWYGDHEVSSETCRVFRNRTDEMKREMAQTGAR